MPTSNPPQSAEAPSSGDANTTFKAPRQPWQGQIIRHLVDAMHWCLARVVHRVHVHGREHFRNAPGAIIIMNHKLDMDGIVGAPTVRWMGGGRGPFGRMAYVGVEHAFYPGFLGAYVVPRPRWFSRILYQLNLDRVLRSMRIYPVPHARSRLMLAHLLDVQELYGDLPLGDIFCEGHETYFPGVPPETTISAVQGFKHRQHVYALHDFTIFKEPYAEALWRRHQARIDTSLKTFAAVLDEGDALAMAPEGNLSPDGRLGRIRSGLSQIIALTKRDVSLFPMAVTYDFMTTGRIPVHLVLGPFMTGVQDWPRERLDAEVAKTLVSLSTVTLGQLAASALLRHLNDGHASLNETDWKAEVRERAHEMRRDGFRVAPNLLDDGAFEARWRKFMGYCARNQTFARRDGHLEFVPDAILSEGITGVRTVSPWVYAANELDTILTYRATPD